MTVYVAANPSKGRGRIYHVDHDCSRLDEAHNVLERDLDVLPDDVRACKWCDGDGPERHRGGKSGLWQKLDAMDADAVGGSSA